jgi:hypothetical protein
VIDVVICVKRVADDVGIRLTADTGGRRALVAVIVVTVGLLAGSQAGCGGHTNRRPLLRISTPHTPLWCPIGDMNNFDARKLLGMPESDAAMTAARHGCRSRVVKVDGRPMAFTAEVRPDRVDLTVEHDIVTAVRIG